MANSLSKWRLWQPLGDFDDYGEDLIAIEGGDWWEQQPPRQ